ncbi:ATP-binding protein [Agrilactobacillus yilanensis]|uniref:Signal transduction histidine-protein kinase ArlS n=1 Tax=Agrilactobacillus yilanensis TaxID=2485997 RepID=A0ABW4J9N5_9LACO|nr:HAMP domain-containing histidine kinase [Agrilactobacillus yilanensis]
MEDQNQKKKRGLKRSLKAKWTLGMAGIILGTLLIFFCVIYYTVQEVLISQEETTVRETITAVDRRLDTATTNLTTNKVLPRLNIETNNETTIASSASWDQTDVFQDSVIQKLSRKDINVGVYDAKGIQLFTTKATSLPLKNKKVGVHQRQVNNQKALVGIGVVYSRTTHKKIGYIQVVNTMSSFQHNMSRLRLFIVIYSIVAVVIGGLASFLIIRHFLKPIGALSDAIEVIKVEPGTQMRVPALNTGDELADLTDEFNHMLDKTQRFVDAQNHFVQDVSHELRTPVAVLEGHLQLLNRWGKDDPEVLDESLGASLQEIQRMKYLIQEMLDLSRADQIEEQYAHETIDVHALVEEVYNNFKMLHPDFNIVLDLDLHQPEVYVQIYRNHLEQVLIILLDNAVKYSDKRKAIHISVAQDARFVNVAIQDFGLGIPEEDRRKIFDRFYRVDKARNRDQDKGGNGLGLSIAQKLIESYQGRISVESSVGSGSIFRIDVPLAVKRNDAVAAEAKAETDSDSDKPIE